MRLLVLLRRDALVLGIFALNGEQLNFKNQRGAGPDLRARGAISIRQL